MALLGTTPRSSAWTKDDPRIPSHSSSKLACTEGCEMGGRKIRRIVAVERQFKSEPSSRSADLI
jgi:hypothetical protein